MSCTKNVWKIITILKFLLLLFSIFHRSNKYRGTGRYLQNTTLRADIRSSQVEFRRFAGKNVGLFEARENVCQFRSSILSESKHMMKLFSFTFFFFFPPFSKSYTKPKGQLPDYNSPVVLNTERRTVEDFCNKLHRSIAKEFK